MASGTERRARRQWLTGEVWAISLSAFFADLGYKAVLAGFPLLLVVGLHQPVWEYGLASGLSYGGGALLSWVGGRVGDRIGHRRVAVAGNVAIPLLSLCGLVASPAWAIGLLTGGWWARNLRSPSRRMLLVRAVPDEGDRARAFGFLHALDVGGGALAGCYLLVAVAAHAPLRWVFVATALPLVVSTLALLRVRADRAVGRLSPAAVPEGRAPEAVPGGDASGPPEAVPEGHDQGPAAPDAASHPGPRGPSVPVSVPALAQDPALASVPSPPPGVRPLLVAAALYGFTLYSAGFPVLTVAQRGGDGLVAGVGAFLVLETASALVGAVVGGRAGRGPAGQMARLGLLGYLAAAIGAGGLAVAAATGAGTAALLGAVAVIGAALGVVETVEPTAMSILRTGPRAGQAMGALSASRSVGTFVGNVVMGLLYGVSAAAAYGYAAAVAGLAAVVVLLAVPTVSRWQRDRPGAARAG